MMKDWSSNISIIAYGWGGVFAVLKPIGEFLGNSIALSYELVKMLGNAALAIGALATRQFAVADVAWEEAKKSAAAIADLSIKNRKILDEDIIGSIEAYDKKVKAALSANTKIAEAEKFTFKGLPGGGGDDKAAEKADLKAIKDKETAYRSMYDQLKFLSDDYYEFSIGQFAAERKQHIKATGDEAKAKELADQVYAEKKKALDEDLYDFYFKEVDAAYKKAAEVVEKQGAALKEVEDAYQRLLNTMAPATDRTYEFGQAVEVMTAKFGAGTPELQAAIDKLKEYYAVLDKEDKTAAAQTAADEAGKQAQLYKDLGGMEDEYRQKKLEWIGLEAEAKFKAADQEVEKAAWVAEMKKRFVREEMEAVGTKFDYEYKYVNESIANTGKMLDAAQTMYKKDSSEYKRLAEAKKAVQIAELAMTVAKNVQIIASNLGLISSNTAVTMSNAGAAVTGAAIGVGPTGFATASAMIALLAGVFAMYGIASGGGGGSASAPSLPASTVLGAEAGTASESISKSYKLLQDTYDMEYDKLTNIYNEMKELNQNISGLVANIVRNYGTFESGKWETTGAAKEKWETFTKNTYSTYFDLLAVAFTGVVGFVGDWMNKSVGWVLNEAFGGSSKTKITESGIGIGDISAGSLIGGEDVSAYEYADFRKKTEGGWFGKDKKEYWTEYEALNEGTTDLLTSIYKNISETLVELSTGLGADTQAALDYVFESVEINLQGMSGEDINETLQAHFSAVGDIAVETLFENLLGGYQKLEEGLLETAIRLVTDKEIVLNALEKTNQLFKATDAITTTITKSLTQTQQAELYLKNNPDVESGWAGTAESHYEMYGKNEGRAWETVSTYTQTTTDQIIAFSEAMIEMAGGLDELIEANANYFDKFFSDTEKQSWLQSQLLEILTAMNMTLPEVRAGYRAIIEGLDLTTESGLKASVSLAQLSEYADEYYEYLEDIAKQQRDMEIQIMELSGDAAGALAAQRADELAATDESLRSLQERIYALQDEESAADAATAIAEQRRSLEIQIMELSGDAAGALAAQRADELAAMDESLRSLQERIYALQDLESAESNLRAAFEAEKTLLTDAYNNELDALNTRLTTIKTTVSELTDMVETLSSAKDSMSMADETYLTGMYQYSQLRLAEVLEQARGGDLSGVNGLEQVLSVLTSADNSMYYTTATDYQRTYWKTYNSIYELQDIAEGQLTVANSEEQLLQEQIDLLGTQHTEELAALDNQLNALLGIEESALSIADAIAAFIAAQAGVLNTGGQINTAAAENIIGSMYETILDRTPEEGGKEYWMGRMTGAIEDIRGGTTTEILKEMIASTEWAGQNAADIIEGLYETILGRQPDTSGETYWNAILATGTPVSRIVEEMMGSEEYLTQVLPVRGFASGGDHPGGWRVVGERGPEIEYTGPSMIYNRSQSKSLLGTEELLSEIKRLRLEIGQQNHTIAKNTGKFARLLDRWDGDGLPAERTV